MNYLALVNQLDVDPEQEPEPGERSVIYTIGGRSTRASEADDMTVYPVWDRGVAIADLEGYVRSRTKGSVFMVTDPGSTDLLDLIAAEPSLRERFDALADSWVEATRFSSSAHDLILHEDYQRIIAMGPEIVPLLLERAVDSPGRWLWPLSIVAGDDPADGIDDLDAAVAAWVRWADDRNLDG